MTNAEEQEFLNKLEKKLWISANKLLPSLDALGLVCLKYVSDAFDIRRDELTRQFNNPEHDYFLDPADFGGADSAEEDDELFADKMARLTTQLKTQFAESDRLEAVIKKNLAGLDYDV